MNQNSSCQSGNALFLILIAVALFAALAFVIMQGRGPSTQSMRDDQEKIIAQEIISYTNTLADTVQKLKLRGCADTALDFYNTIWTFNGGAALPSSNHNPNAQPGCGVFSSTEGKANAVKFPKNYFYDFTGITAGNPDFGSGIIITPESPEMGNNTKGDIVFRLAYIPLKLCLRLNDMLGVKNLSATAPPSISGNPLALNSYYLGTFPSMIVSDTSGAINGKSAYCVNHGVGAHLYSYMAVLLAR